MELKNEFLHNENARNALTKLFGTNFDSKTTFNIRKIHYQFVRNFERTKKEIQDIIKKHADLDDKGNFIPDMGPYGCKFKEGKLAEAQKEVNEFMQKTFALSKCDKVKASVLVNSSELKWSSFDMEAIEPLIEGLDLGLE